MPWFKCFVAGHNFPGNLVDESLPVGFYTTCFVEASSLDTAEAEALKSLRKDKRLKLPKGLIPPIDAKVFIEEIIEIPAQEVPHQREGFVWYVMEAE